MIDPKLNEAINVLETYRFALQDHTNKALLYRTDEKRYKEFAEEEEKTVAECQARFDAKLLDLRKLMSGRESEVPVPPPVVDPGDQVGREG